jgi:hypothetical protein
MPLYDPDLIYLRQKPGRAKSGHAMRRSASARRSRPALAGSRPASARSSALSRTPSTQGLVIPMQMRTSTAMPSQYLFKQMHPLSGRPDRPGTAPSSRQSHRSMSQFAIPAHEAMLFAKPTNEASMRSRRSRQQLRPTTAGPLRMPPSQGSRKPVVREIIHSSQPPKARAQSAKPHASKSPNQRAPSFASSPNLVTFDLSTSTISELETDTCQGIGADIVQLACSPNAVVTLDASGQVKLIPLQSKTCDGETNVKSNNNNNNDDDNNQVGLVDPILLHQQSNRVSSSPAGTHCFSPLLGRPPPTKSKLTVHDNHVCCLQCAACCFLYWPSLALRLWSCREVLRNQ